MKVSRKVYLLVLIIEECAEIIHRTCKSIRFGMEERWKPESEDNRALLEQEIMDLQVVLSLNRKEGNLSGVVDSPPHSKVRIKLERLNKYMAYSQDHCKTISNEEGHNPPLVYTDWKTDQKPKCRHGNDAATCGVCEDIRTGNVNTEG